MLLAGLDSAYEPNDAQVAAAWQQGFRVWAVYVHGPGALHNWSPEGIFRVRNAGFAIVAVFVPRLDLSTDPASDARGFVGALQGLGLDSGVLDTEASMRGNPHLATYEAVFGDTMIGLGFAAGTYAGGFSLSHPPKHPPWWIIVGQPPPGQAYQTGQVNIAGLNCDRDVFDSAFPMSHSAPLPPPAPVSSPDPVITEGAAMPRVTFTIPLAGGNGWVLLDGSDARVGHAKVPYGDLVTCEAEGSYPPTDGYWPGVAKAQDRGGFACVSFIGGSGGQANVSVVVTTAAQAATAEEIAEHERAGTLVTADNWQGFEGGPGGGQHDPENVSTG